VAIKVLTSEAGSDMLTRFRNEAMAAGNLRHENIITIYEFGQENGVPFIAMEYLEGEDLQQVIRAGRKLTLLEKDPNNGSNRRRTGMRAPLVAEARTDQAQGDLVLE
jgi:serine/threonine protein kinase